MLRIAFFKKADGNLEFFLLCYIKAAIWKILSKLVSENSELFMLTAWQKENFCKISVFFHFIT